MKNLELARIFREIADLLELKEIEFKPRAYREAARTIQTLSKNIEEVAEEGKLEELPGIGKSIAAKIKEYIETNQIEEYEELKKEFPIDYEQLLSVEGLGPKTVKKLFEELDITNLDELEKAAKEKKIRLLEGMGEKSEKSILRHIDFARKDSERKLLGFILPVAEEIKNKLQQLNEVERIEIAGSIRRRKETIGDIDLVVQTTDSEPVMDYFTSMDNVVDIIAKGKSKSTVRLREGLDADLRIISKDAFGTAYLYFTGSLELTLELRQMAVDKDLKLSEYGLFKKDEKIAGKTEEDVLENLGLRYIEPELRENRGEIEAARNDALPDLIGYDAIRGDLQCHTTWSDGKNTIKEMVQEAKEMGYEYIAITDHTDTLRIANGLNAERIKKQISELVKINEEIEGITVLKGLEVNIDEEGNVDIEDKILKKMDVIVAGVHTGLRNKKEDLTKRIVTAMENPYVNIIAHPTGRKLLKREASDINLEEIFEISKETNTFLEINSQPNRLDISDSNAKKAIEMGCKIVINTDAHSTEQLRYMKYGIATARRAWAEPKDVLNTFSLDKLLRVINNK